MKRSFRLQLALRFTATMAVGAVVITVASLVTLKTVLDREVDSSLAAVASIQAASVTDAPDGSMRFHEWELTPSEADSLQDLVRYAQIWQEDGVSLLRSRYMTADLPLDEEALQRSAEGELVRADAVFQGIPIRSLYYPLERLGAAHHRHVLQVSAPLNARNAMLRRVAAYLALISALVVGGSFAGSWWLAGRALRPVREITGQAEEIEARSLKRGISAYSDTAEYHRLVQVLNSMLSRLQGSFDAQRRFTADASHELRSPLTAMRGELELALRRERDPEEYRRVIGSTLEEAVRLSRMAEDLLTLARTDAGAVKAHTTPVDVAQLVGDVAERLRTTAMARDVTVRVDAVGDTSAVADADMLGRAAWNLLDNATRHAPPGSTVDVRVEGNGDRVTLEVLDRGPGLGHTPPDQVFERFFRADASRSVEGGTGLGLAIVKAIAEVHHGTVEAGARPGGGARFVLRIPAGRES